MKVKTILITLSILLANTLWDSTRAADLNMNGGFFSDGESAPYAAGYIRVTWPDTRSYGKPLGAFYLSTGLIYNPFQKHGYANLRGCPTAASRTGSPSSDVVTSDQRKCHSVIGSWNGPKQDCIGYAPEVTDPKTGVKSWGGCNAWGPEYYTREVVKKPNCDQLVDVFWVSSCWNKPEHPDAYALTERCGFGSDVFDYASQLYRYDNVPPVCIRNDPGIAPVAGWSEYKSPEDMAKLVQEVRANGNTNDKTIIYANTDPQLTYTWIWTNRVLIGQWLCADGHSGCSGDNSIPYRQNPLIHRQMSWTTPMSDIATNDTIAVCDSTVRSIKDVKQTCRYFVGNDYVDEFLKTPAAQKLTPEDKDWLLTFQAWIRSVYNPTNHPSITTPNILRLRNILQYTTGKSYYDQNNNTLPKLFDFMGQCTSRIILDEAVIPPLIDRIKPTVVITDVNTEDNHATPQVLLDNEKNISDTIASYYAGYVSFRFTLTDSGSSTYVWNPISRWKNYAGVSGIKSYDFKIERVKDHLMRPITNEVYDFQPFQNPLDLSRASDSGMDLKPESISVKWPGYLRKTWLYRITVRVSDHAGNVLSTLNDDKTVTYFKVVPSVVPCSQDICIPTMPRDQVDAIRAECNAIPIGQAYPPKCTRSDLGVVTPEPQNPPGTKLYADANTLYNMVLTFYDRFYNEIYSKDVKTITQTGVTISLDAVDPKGQSAIVTEMNGNGTDNPFTANIPWRTNGSGAMSIRSFSYTPGIFEIHYRGRICLWDNYDTMDCDQLAGYDANLRDSYPEGKTITGEFLHIFTGAITLDENVAKRVNLGASNNIGLSLIPTQDPIPPTLRTVALDTSHFTESLRSLTSRFAVTKTGSYEHNSGYIFSSIIPQNNKSVFTPEQTNLEDTFTNNDLNIRTDPIAALTLKGIDGISKLARYYISPKENYYGSGLTYSEGRLNRIYIEGYKQTVGKEKYVINKENIVTTVSTNEFRNLVYKNVALLTRNRTPDTNKIVNNIKYVRGDQILTSGPTDADNWDTLIVEDGNITIDTEYFNPDKKKVALVVLSKNNPQKWNVYITPKVRFIAANIFADASVLSVDQLQKKPFEPSDATRTAALQNQIVFYGNIFSRNTVGGAIRGLSGVPTYVLPRWSASETTTSLDEAIKYDLSFLRMNNGGAEMNRPSGTAEYNDGHKESVILLVNMDFFQNPLPVFSTTLQ